VTLLNDIRWPVGFPVPAGKNADVGSLLSGRMLGMRWEVAYNIGHLLLPLQGSVS